MHETRAALRKRAIVFDVGGARPPEDPAASWFGRVNLCGPGEVWPSWHGSPMTPLCQVNLRQLPYHPPHLEGIAMLAVFVDARRLPDGTPNGEGWLLRAYHDADRLVPLESPGGFTVKAMPLFARAVDDDFPCREDVPIKLPEDIADGYSEAFPNLGGTKLGGWPTLIQSEIFWAPSNEHPANPEYVFQVDSSEKGHWAWGDQGVGYFGRGTAPGHTDEWTMTWQCY